MEIAAQYRSRLTLLAAVTAAVLLALLFARPAGSVIPASAAVGKVTYEDLSGTTDVTMTIRSFTTNVQLAPGAPRATFAAPRVVHDVVPTSPLIMAGVASGKHYKSVTVVLYHPGTTTRSQQLLYADVQLTLDLQTQNGPASATPWETVSWNFHKVTQTTYQANGVTVSTSACYDVVMFKAC